MNHRSLKPKLRATRADPGNNAQARRSADSGLHFDESVPQKIIELPAPELTGANAEPFEIIDYKDTVRLARQPGSYTVLIYRRPVVRHKRDHSLSEVAAPSNVLEGFVGDVSVIQRHQKRTSLFVANSHSFP